MKTMYKFYLALLSIAFVLGSCGNNGPVNTMSIMLFYPVDIVVT